MQTHLTGLFIDLGNAGFGHIIILDIQKPVPDLSKGYTEFNSIQYS
jgi:hypothetical protein